MTGTNAERRAAWLAERRKAITSGDVPAILGIDGSMMAVWLAKMGLSEAGPGNERMEWGLRLQRAILEGYADKIQQPIVHADPYTFVRFHGEPLIGATLDARWAAGDLRPVDAKNIAVKRPDLWGRDGSGVVPDKYALQLHVQMMVTGTSCADLAVLFGGNHLEVFHVERDPVVWEQIVEAARRFWTGFVEPAVSPPPDGSDAWRGFLRGIRQVGKAMLATTPEIDAAMRELGRVKLGIARAEEREAALEAEIKSFIGGEAGCRGPPGKVTWRQGADRRTVDYEAAVNALVAVHPEWAAEILETCRRHGEIRPGSRRFMLSLYKVPDLGLGEEDETP